MSADLGERIREEREWLGFCPDLVANALRLATTDVLAFEAGEREPTEDQLTSSACPNFDGWLRRSEDVLCARWMVEGVGGMPRRVERRSYAASEMRAQRVSRTAGRSPAV